MEKTRIYLRGLKQALSLPKGASEAIEAAFGTTTPTNFESPLLAALRAAQTQQRPFLRGKLIYLLVRARVLAQEPKNTALLSTLQHLLSGLSQAHGDVTKATASDLRWWVRCCMEAQAPQQARPPPAAAVVPTQRHPAQEPPPAPSPKREEKEREAPQDGQKDGKEEEKKPKATPAPSAPAASLPPTKSTAQEQETLRSDILTVVWEDYVPKDEEEEEKKPRASASSKTATTAQTEIDESHAILTFTEWLELKTLMQNVKINIPADFQTAFETTRYVSPLLRHTQSMAAMRICGPTISRVLTMLKTVAEKVDERAQERAKTDTRDALMTDIKFTEEEEGWLTQIATLSNKVVRLTTTSGTQDSVDAGGSCSTEATHKQSEASGSKLLAKIRKLTKTGGK